MDDVCRHEVPLSCQPKQTAGMMLASSMVGHFPVNNQGSSIVPLEGNRVTKYVGTDCLSMVLERLLGRAQGRCLSVVHLETLARNSSNHYFFFRGFVVLRIVLGLRTAPFHV